MFDQTTVSSDQDASAFADLHQAYLRWLQAESLGAWLRLDVTVPQLKVLQVLAYDGPRTPSALARVLDVSPSTITGLCDRLVEHGFARREEDPRDRRVNRVSATEEGRSLLERLTASRRERVLRLFDSLASRERSLALEAFRALLAAVKTPE